jgi:hypothetical protein
MSRLRHSSGRWIVAGLALFAASCAARSEPQDVRYFYYLHGKIVEDLGPRGVSPRHGAYDYPGIIAALRRAGLTVESEVRPKNTDPRAYAAKIVADVRAKLRGGVPASHITIAGASKGSVIASIVATQLQQPQIRYVLIANCNDWLIREIKPRLSGEVLSIYETSDEIGQSCMPLVRLSPKVSRFSEIRLETGLGHGVVYRPMREWLTPAIAWARR